MQAHEFAVLGRLARQVPIHLVDRPDGLQHLPAQCDAIVQAVDAMEQRAAIEQQPARVKPA
jgi:hypothetical protein